VVYVLPGLTPKTLQFADSVVMCSVWLSH